MSTHRDENEALAAMPKNLMAIFDADRRWLRFVRERDYLRGFWEAMTSAEHDLDHILVRTDFSGEARGFEDGWRNFTDLHHLGLRDFSPDTITRDESGRVVRR